MLRVDHEPHEQVPSVHTNNDKIRSKSSCRWCGSW